MSYWNTIATTLKPVLYPFSLLYGGVMWVRNKFYDKKWYASVEFSFPVIAVGNLTVGGTGKTPHIEYLIELLSQRYQIATMSRGYKRKTKGFLLADETSNANQIGDEPYQFYKKYPRTIVSVCEERLTGIPYLLTQEPNIDVILLDDAFQHRAVRPGLNILLSDYNRPFYKDYVLPLGRLRESRKGYKRADIIIVTKCPDISLLEQEEISKKIKPLPHQQLFFSKIVYDSLRRIDNQEIVNINRDTGIILVSGIAHPSQMLEYLEQQTKNIHLLKYPDHHYFSTADIEEIKNALENLPHKEKFIVTTEKDATRLSLHDDLIKKYNLNILVLPIKVELLNNKSKFEERVIQYIEEARVSDTE